MQRWQVAPYLLPPLLSQLYASLCISSGLFFFLITHVSCGETGHSSSRLIYPIMVVHLLAGEYLCDACMYTTVDI
jgi:hypothetical protein